MDNKSTPSVRFSVLEGISEHYARPNLTGSETCPAFLDIAFHDSNLSLSSNRNSAQVVHYCAYDTSSNIAGNITIRSSMRPRKSVLRRIRTICKREHGSSLLEVSLVLPFIVMFVAGGVDLGRALYYSNNLTRAASAAATYGSQNPTDVTGMENMVKADAAGVPGVSATASYGCECQDGTQASASCSTQPSCTTGTVYYVTVTASSSISPIIQWPGIPSPMSISSTSTMRGGE